MAIWDPELPFFLFSKTPFHDIRYLEFTASMSASTAPISSETSVNFIALPERNNRVPEGTLPHHKQGSDTMDVSQTIFEE